MEVSLRVVVCLLFCVLVCGVHSTTAAEEVVIKHNGKFDSDLVLTCTDGLFILNGGVSFQRNNMSIRGSGGGTFEYPLNQTSEGRFTCTHNGQTSEPIALAGIIRLKSQKFILMHVVSNMMHMSPTTAVPTPTPQSYYVLVSVSELTSTELACDIGPGPVRESYSDIEWRRHNSDGSFTIIREGISQETFNLTLEVNLSHNNAVYQCRVSIDHDGVGTGESPIPRDGAEITLYTAGKAACAPYHCSVCTDSDSPATQ